CCVEKRVVACLVGFRSAKARPFAERKATMNRKPHRGGTVPAQAAVLGKKPLRITGPHGGDPIRGGGKPVGDAPLGLVDLILRVHRPRPLAWTDMGMPRCGESCHASVPQMAVEGLANSDWGF